jgi:methylated-DNA-[protein]-cysteine S-methyltransferase
MESTHRHYLVFDTAFGAGGIAWSERGLTRLLLPGADGAALAARLSRRATGIEGRAPPPAIAGLVAAIVRYFAGERVEFDGVALDLAGVEDFSRRVYAETGRLRWGSTASYGDIARRLGAGPPDGARDVGQALARNPVPLVVPCHRVLAAGERIGGFSAPGGVATKARMLELEGVRPGVDARQGSLFASGALRPAAAPH